MKSKEKKTRNYHLDNIKFILITLVAIGHFIEPLTTKSLFLRNLFFFIYLFHMPLFIFISGYFSKNFYDGKQIKVEKIISYLILFGIFQIIDLIILQKPFSITNIPNIPWYLFSMVIWQAIIPFIYNLKEKYVLVFSFLLAILIGFDNNASDMLAIGRIINYLPFFLLGYYCQEKHLNKIIQKKWIIPSIILIIIVIFIVFSGYFDVYKLRPLITGRNPYYRLTSKKYLAAICRIIYYPAIISLSIAIMNLVPKTKNIFSKIGTRTLQIYVLHFFVYRFFAIKQLYNPIINHFKAWPIIIILIAIITTIVLSLKIFEYPFKWLLKCKWNWLKKEKIN